MTQVTIRAPAGLVEALRKEAGERGVSLNHYVWYLVEKGRECVPPCAGARCPEH